MSLFLLWFSYISYDKSKGERTMPSLKLQSQTQTQNITAQAIMHFTWTLRMCRRTLVADVDTDLI